MLCAIVRNMIIAITPKEKKPSSYQSELQRWIAMSAWDQYSNTEKQNKNINYYLIDIQITLNNYGNITPPCMHQCNNIYQKNINYAMNMKNEVILNVKK